MASEEKDPSDPSTTSDAYDLMVPRWAKINALLGGTAAMRAAGEAYLPMHRLEEQKDYDERLACALLLPMVEHTLNVLSGKPFAEPLKLSDSVPTQVKDLCTDIDLQGNNLDVFCHGWFREGVAKAFCHVLVENPRKREGQATKADDRVLGTRPYWVLIRPECLIDADEKTVNGVRTLVHVRILESYTERDGFSSIERQQIRVITPEVYQLWRVREKTKEGKAVWGMVEEWPNELGEVPVVTFYTHREGLLLGKPPLLDLADLNITHWQSSSDQRHVLTVARFPILAASGAGSSQEGDGDQKKDVAIGPNAVLYMPDPAGKYYYVEHSGAAIEAGRKDLEELEAKMSGYGAEFLRERPGGQTATAAAIDSAEMTSPLRAMVTVFRDAVARALYYTARWQKLELSSAGTVEINTRWSSLGLTPKEILEAVRAARKEKEISRDLFLAVLQGLGVVPDDFNMEEEAERLAKEVQERPLSPLELAQALAAVQGKLLALSEGRAAFRRSGLAPLTDESAKDEIEATLDYSTPVVPPGGMSRMEGERPAEEGGSTTENVPPQEDATSGVT